MSRLQHRRVSCHHRLHRLIHRLRGNNVNRIQLSIRTIGQQFLLLAAVCAMSGCQMPGGGPSAGSLGALGTVSIPNPMNWGANEEEPRFGRPERMVATWVDTVLQRPGEPAQRGFGGRVYFYDQETDPVAVEGRLVVYAFDETGRAPTNHEPTRRYIFPPEQLPLHRSESKIGQSYSFWLPWDEVGGTQTEVSLIARFEPLDGSGLIVSEGTRQQLPGRMLEGAPEMLYAEGESKGSVKRASYDQSAPVKQAAKAPNNEKPRRRLSTTTIQLGK